MNLSMPGLAPSGQLCPRSCYQTIVRVKANNVCPGHFSTRGHRFGARAQKLFIFLKNRPKKDKVRSASHCIALEFCWPVTQACLCWSTRNFHTMFRCWRKVENLGGPQIWGSREAPIPQKNFSPKCVFSSGCSKKRIFRKKIGGGQPHPPNYFLFLENSLFGCKCFPLRSDVFFEQKFDFF